MHEFIDHGIHNFRKMVTSSMTNHTSLMVGGLKADILRYNADNLSTTMKLWGKLD